MKHPQMSKNQNLGYLGDERVPYPVLLKGISKTKTPKFFRGWEEII